MKTFLFSLTILLLIQACQKESANTNKPEKVVLPALVDTVIYSKDTLYYDLGYYGDEEGVSIITPPKNATTCTILMNNGQERTLKYIPKDTFLGKDSLVIASISGSDGASLSTDTETVKVLIKVVQNRVHKELIGKWRWLGSCGGFTGGCWYPDDNDHQQIEFTYDMRYIETHNDTITRRLNYLLLDSSKINKIERYAIRFNANYTTYFWYNADTLNLQMGDVTNTYERVK